MDFYIKKAGNAVMFILAVVVIILSYL